MILKHREISGPSPQNLHQHKHGVCVQSLESLGSAAYSHALQAVNTHFKHLQWGQVLTILVPKTSLQRVTSLPHFIISRDLLLPLTSSGISRAHDDTEDTMGVSSLLEKLTTDMQRQVGHPHCGASQAWL